MSISSTDGRKNTLEDSGVRQAIVNLLKEQEVNDKLYKSMINLSNKKYWILVFDSEVVTWWKIVCVVLKGGKILAINNAFPSDEKVTEHLTEQHI